VFTSTANTKAFDIDMSMGSCKQWGQRSLFLHWPQWGDVAPEDELVVSPLAAADVDVGFAVVGFTVVAAALLVAGGGVVPPLIAATWSTTRLVHSLVP
jgi:hypothetical protein